MASKSNITIKHANCLFLNLKNPDHPEFFVPAYARIKINNIKSISFEELNAEVNLTIMITFMTKGLPMFIIEKMKENIVLMFGRDDAIQLTPEGDNLDTTRTVYAPRRKIKKKQSHVEHDDKKGQYEEVEEGFTYTIRRIVNTKMEPYIFLTPFEVVDLIFTITIRKLTVTVPGYSQKFIDVRFNLMDKQLSIQHFYNKIAFTEEGTFGNYDLAERRIWAEYTNFYEPKSLIQLKKNIYNWEICDIAAMDKEEEGGIFETLGNLIPGGDQSDDEEEKTDLTEFNIAHFHMPIYRFPTVALGTIFFPLWLLGIINLAIFFQENELSSRIGSIATLMIAFVALIPIIRQQVPPNPSITLIEILVYIQTGTSFLCLIESFVVSYGQEGDDNFFKNFHPWSNVWFVVSFIITIAVIVIPLVMFLIHWFVFEPSHNIGPREERLERDFSTWTDNNDANVLFSKYWEQDQLNSKRKDPHLREDKKITFFVENTIEFNEKIKELYSSLNLFDQLLKMRMNEKEDIKQESDNQRIQGRAKSSDSEKIKLQQQEIKMKTESEGISRGGSEDEIKEPMPLL